MNKPNRSKPYPATLHSTKHLESEGWMVATVEQRIPHTFITKDCYGFADLLAASPSRGIMLVQVTGGAGRSNANARISKICHPDLASMAAIWLASGGRIQVHNWRKVADQKARSLEITEVTIETLEAKL